MNQTDDVPELPRWYQGKFGTTPRPESKQPKVELDAETRAEWRAWQKAEREKPQEDKE